LPVLAQLSVAPTRWEDIGGLVDVKAQLEQAVLWPLLYPETFLRLGITPPRGILLHGPPGTGKTTLARALATQGHASFFSLSGAEVFSPYVGDAERAVRDVFRKARLASPSVVFFDEIDAVVGSRSERSDSGGVQQRLLATLLTELDGIAAGGRVLLVGATNRPEALDSAFVRAVSLILQLLQLFLS
jgi:SpoVK/Ycf46/Vps4 family AAA+-type ATPase